MSELGCSSNTCALHSVLQRQNIDMQKFDYLVAVAGNPNTGKSTVFNALTGLRQHTGNWPGKTVARAEGVFEIERKKYKLVDLPGTYSLLSMSAEEGISRDFILFGQPDVTVVVVDATNVERNLNLVLQILDITGRAVLCLNLMDEAVRKGITINEYQLEGDLGIPVVPTSARYRKGLGKLTEAIAGVANGTIKTTPRKLNNSMHIQNALKELIPLVEETLPGIPNARWIAMRLLDGDDSVIQWIQNEGFALITGDEHNAAAERELVFKAV